MKNNSTKAVSTTIVIVIIVVLIVAAIGGIYLASQNHSTSTTTSTVTQTGTGSTVTTTVSTGGSSTSSIAAGELNIGVVSPEWGTNHIGDDVQCGWGEGWYSYNYEQLFQYSPSALKAGNYVPVPWLASNYTESSNGLTYVINLQQNVKFHSGNVMTPADVVYSINRFVFDNNLAPSFQNCPGAGEIYRNSFASFKNISATGANQVTLTLNYPDPNVLNEFANQGMSILDSKLLAQHTVTGANNTSDYGFAWLDAGPQDAGTGPFQLTSFTYEARAELQSFAGYWGGVGNNYTSNVKTVVMIPYADPTTAQFALLQGQINEVQDETTNAIHSISQTAGFSVLTQPSFLGFSLYMHPVGPLADWRVRDAVKAAINYTALASTLTNGYGKSDSSILFSGMQGYNSTTANYYAKAGPNVSGATALLKAAGYPHGFTVNLYTRPSSRYGVTFVDMSEILQSDLAAVNITINIQVYVVGEFYTLAENTSLAGIWTVPNSLIVLSPSSNIAEWYGSGNQLFVGWSASTEKGPGVPFSQLTLLENETATAPTLAQANVYAAQFDQLYNQYGPVIQMFQLSNTIGYSNSVQGVVWNSVTDQGIPNYLSIT